MDRASVAAHLGIARAYLYRMQFGQVRDAIDRALTQNPRSADAIAAQVEFWLYERRFSEVLERVAEGLAFHPRHPQLLACRAAAHILLGHDEAPAAVQAMLDSDPRNADGLRLIGDLVGFHYRFAESIPYFRRALEVDPNWALSYVGLARSLANTGRSKDALEALAEFRKRDEFRYPWVNNMRLALEEVEAGVEVRHGNFLFLIDPLESPVLGPLLVELYQRRWKDATTRYGLDPDRQLRIEVFARHNDFSSRTVGFIGFGALGVCFGDSLALLSPRSELRGTFHYERTAVHELCHVVSLALSNQRVPRWLTEGMSVYEERVFSQYCDREMDYDLFNYYHSGEIIPILELNRLFSGPKILFGYYQSGLLCEYLVGLHGEKILTQMLQEYALDRETGDVVRRVLKMEPEELDAAFLAWLFEMKVSPMKVQPVYTAHGRRRLLQEVGDGEAASADLLAQLAWAYHQAGLKVDRDDFLGRALRRDPDLPAALFLAGDRAAAAGRTDLAKEHLRRGLEREDGQEFFALLRLAQLLRQEGETDEALDLLARAKECFPRFVGPANPYLTRARILQREGREEEALEERRQFCAIDETDIEQRATLVARAFEREDFGEALQYLTELRAIDPFQRDLHRKIASCYKEQAQPWEAVKSLRLALSVDPATEPSYDSAEPEEERRERDRAERAQLLLDLAEIFQELGELEQARTTVEEARALDGSSPRMEALLQEISAGQGP